MKTRSVPAALSLVVAGCASAPAHSPRPQPRDVRIVRGNGYNKSVYEDGGRMIVSFQIDVRNKGTDAGKSGNPRCHVVVDDELIQLEVLQNPELEPGEKGQLRTGGPIPPLSHREIDDLEAYCGL